MTTTKEPLSNRALFVENNERQAAIEYLERRCLGRVKALEKGNKRLKPVRIVKTPEPDPRNPIFADHRCLRCSKIVGSEGLFCVRPR